MTADYFSALELPRNFELDLTDLEKRYFAAQRQFHPDRLVGKNAAERQQAIGQSMLINEAYETLKSPLKRAQHLLAIAGVAQDSVKPPQELLMEIMELREALAEADGQEALTRLALQNEAAKAQTLAALPQAFAKPDMMQAAQLAMRLSYLVKLGDEIRIRLKTAD